MTWTELRVPTTGGEIEASLGLPDGAGPWPLVVFYMDAGGLRPAMYAMAERVVAAGHAVLMPNLYWRSGAFAPIDGRTVFQVPAERQRMMSLMQARKTTEAVADTRALLAAVAGDARIAPGPFGCVGYCMGGKVAFVVATALGAQVAAVASIHGGGLVSDAPDSPHRGAADIRAQVYLGVADQDGSCTPEHQAVLHAALSAAGVRYRLEVYTGARHGFAVLDFPVYAEAAAERHWQAVLGLFGETLGR